MTIKTRNRLIFAFFITAVLISIFELTLYIIQIIRGNLQLPEITFAQKTSRLFLFKYKSIYVILGIFLKNLYICGTTYLMYRAFEKTQTTEVFYFTIFLLGCLCDSVRMLTILFHISYTYSNTLITSGNIVLFTRVLIPLALTGTVLFNEESQRQNIERNSLLFIVVATFLADIIPLNTAIIKPNFIVSYGYEKTIIIFTVIIHAINIFTLIFRNINQGQKQFTTIGYVSLSVGYILIFNSYSLFNLIIGFLCLCGGTALFLRSLHKYYLWND